MPDKEITPFIQCHFVAKTGDKKAYVKIGDTITDPRGAILVALDILTLVPLQEQNPEEILKSFNDAELCLHRLYGAISRYEAKIATLLDE